MAGTQLKACLSFFSSLQDVESIISSKVQVLFGTTECPVKIVISSVDNLERIITGCLNVWIILRLATPVVSEEKGILVVISFVEPEAFNALILMMISFEVTNMVMDERKRKEKPLAFNFS